MGPNQPPRSRLMTPLKGFLMVFVFTPVTHFLGHLWHVLHVLLSCTHISFFVFPRSHGWRKFDSTYKIETSTDGSIGSIILNQSSGIFWILLFSWAMWDPISSAFCSSKFSRRCFKLLTFTHSISLGSEGILCHAWEQGFPASRLRILQMLVSSSHQMGDWLVAKRRFAGLRLAKNTNFATAWPTECQASCLWQASGMAYGSL